MAGCLPGELHAGAHVEKVVEDRLYASTVSRDFLGITREPPAPSWFPRLQYFVLIGTIPEGARRKLGIEWTARDELLLRAIGKTVPYTIPLLPERLRYFPIAYEARRLERNRQRLRKVLELRPM